MKNRQRRRYVKAMFRAIDLARNYLWKEGRSSKTNGLRVIRRFEKVNGIMFDPTNERHVITCAYCGEDEEFFRAANLMFEGFKS